MYGVPCLYVREASFRTCAVCLLCGKHEMPPISNKNWRTNKLLHRLVGCFIPVFIGFHPTGAGICPCKVTHVMPIHQCFKPFEAAPASKAHFLARLRPRKKREQSALIGYTTCFKGKLGNSEPVGAAHLYLTGLGPSLPFARCRKSASQNPKLAHSKSRAPGRTNVTFCWGVGQGRGNLPLRATGKEWFLHGQRSSIEYMLLWSLCNTHAGRFPHCVPLFQSWKLTEGCCHGTVLLNKNRFLFHDMAMGQNPAPPVNLPIPTKIGYKIGGEFTYPELGSHWF